MSTKTVFTMKLEPELRDTFMAEAAAADRPAAQVLRELMRDYIKQQRDERAYEAFLRNKIDIARASVAAGQGRSNQDVENDFAARRTALLDTSDKDGI